MIKGGELKDRKGGGIKEFVELLCHLQCINQKNLCDGETWDNDKED